jgi:formamidopyrimidine-DNA glycosylase
MPELPEVHTTIEGLKGVIIGKTIKDVWSDFHIGTAHGDRQTIKNKKYFDKFRKIVKGAKIKSLERRGKNILIHLKPRSDLKKSPKGPTLAYTIIVHMKMTGCLMYKKDKNEKYVHLYFSFSSGDYLLLSDLRKFASVTISKTSELNLHESLAKLGSNPLDPKFNSQKLFEIIHNKKSAPIKSALLDQSAIAGIGNIYSDEILWQVGIHPLSLAGKIPAKKFPEIFKSMQKILKFSIKHGGDSKSDYRNAFGGKGSFQNFHKAYGRKGQKCPKPNCPGTIQRIVVRGRSTYFCPKHQVKYE